MEIPEKTPLHSMPTQNRSHEELKEPPAEPSRAQPKTVPRDTVSLTERGREFQTAVHHARLLPEIREDRVMLLKRQLEEGSYCVKGHRIALNMMDEAIQNNIVLNYFDTEG